MSWDFSTDDDYQQQLDWVKQFVHDEIEPLDLVLGHPCDVRDPRRNALVRPLQALVKQRKLWACHLGPELGGQGYGQVKLALLNELLGRSQYGPTVFGCQAPDSGNAEILAHYGSPEQKRRWLPKMASGEFVVQDVQMASLAIGGIVCAGVSLVITALYLIGVGLVALTQGLRPAPAASS